MDFFKEKFGKRIRLTDERKVHIFKHSEMKWQLAKIKQTLLDPTEIRESIYDQEVQLYYRFYNQTPVGHKCLAVVIKTKSADPFLITAFFTDKPKSGKIIWRSSVTMP